MRFSVVQNGCLFNQRRACLAGLGERRYAAWRLDGEEMMVIFNLGSCGFERRIHIPALRFLSAGKKHLPPPPPPVRLNGLYSGKKLF
jgi:hypothetical protein